jgi:hypothetical protein
MAEQSIVSKMSATVNHGMFLSTACYILAVPRALDAASVIKRQENVGCLVFRRGNTLYSLQDFGYSSAIRPSRKGLKSPPFAICVPMGNSFSVRGEIERVELGSPKRVDGATEHSRLPANRIRVGVVNATNQLASVLPCLCSANHINNCVERCGR